MRLRPGMCAARRFRRGGKDIPDFAGKADTVKYGTLHRRRSLPLPALIKTATMFPPRAYLFLFLFQTPEFRHAAVHLHYLRQ